MKLVQGRRASCQNVAQYSGASFSNLKMILLQGSGERFQSLKYFPCNHKDLSSISRAQVKV